MLSFVSFLLTFPLPHSTIRKHPPGKQESGLVASLPFIKWSTSQAGLPPPRFSFIHPIKTFNAFDFVFLVAIANSNYPIPALPN
jgi:hypothetical protein